MSEIATTIKRALIIFVVGLVPALGSGASVAMISVILSFEYVILAPICGLVCGVVVRFVAPTHRQVGAWVAVALAAAGFAIGAVMRGSLRIAIEMAERPPDVLAKLDWSLAGYLVLASLRSNRWVAAIATLLVAFLVVRVTTKNKRG